MEKYESLGVVGEGSYGVVMKCRHKETGQIVAIKKFMEGDEDAQVKKIAMREVRMLKRLRHENLVNLLEVFRRKRRLCLVFEFVECTALDLLEARQTGGLDPEPVRSYTFQLLRALEFCHAQNVIHRDIKPENVLISSLGVLKLCDFGFARPLAAPGENCTDYVATRWYRAPELLVGDTRYGREVDVWAAGCLFSEMLTGEPLFPGDSDIDQLYQIIQTTGPLSKAHLDLLSHNPAMSGLRLSPAVRPRFAVKFPSWTRLQVSFLQDCLEMDPLQRPACKDLLQHEYFTHDDFPQRHAPEIKRKIQLEFSSNSLGRKFGSLAIGKKRKGSKLTPNKENQEHHEAKKEKDVKDALKSSPYRQSQARISVGRLVGSQRQEPGRTHADDLDPTAATNIASGGFASAINMASGGNGGGYPAIDGAPPPLPAHGWVRDTLLGWGAAGLTSDSLAALLPRPDRGRPLAPVGCTKSPACGGGGTATRRTAGPSTACATCQEVSSRGHVATDSAAGHSAQLAGHSAQLAAAERALRQRRGGVTTDVRARHGVSLPNVPGAVSKTAGRTPGKSPFSGSSTQVTTLDLLRTPVSKPPPRTRRWWH